MLIVYESGNPATKKWGKRKVRPGQEKKYLGSNLWSWPWVCDQLAAWFLRMSSEKVNEAIVPSNSMNHGQEDRKRYSLIFVSQWSTFDPWNSLTFLSALHMYGCGASHASVVKGKSPGVRWGCCAAPVSHMWRRDHPPQLPADTGSTMEDQWSGCFSHPSGIARQTCRPWKMNKLLWLKYCNSEKTIIPWLI